jgi:hypothetical protein
MILLYAMAPQLTYYGCGVASSYKSMIDLKFKFK